MDFTLVLFVLPFSSGLERTLAAIGLGWGFAARVLQFLGLPLFFLFLFRFQDGRFAPRWTRRLVPATIVIGAQDPFLRGSAPALPAWLDALLTIGLFGAGLFAQVYRYRRVSSPVERQQSKWVVLGVRSSSPAF